MASPPPKKARLSPSPSRSTEATPAASLSQCSAEVAVGITEYVNPTLPAWSGVLKQRYSDFLVNEVALTGGVVHLKSTRPPQEGPVEEERKKGRKNERINATKANAAAAVAAVEAAPENAQEQLAAIVPAHTAAAIIALSTAPPDTEPVTTPPVANKDARSNFHALIRTLFGQRLITETTSADPPCIIVSRATAATASQERRRSRRGGKNHKKTGWDDLGGEYCHFTLYKENRDTMEVLNLLARLLKLKNGNKAFSFAGTKDRRAVTAQRCAVHLVKAERLAGLNKAGDGGLRGARLGDFEYKPYGLSLGDLKGNEFVITLRQAESLQEGVALEDAVRMCVETVKRTGFTNYYGLQRFGSFDVATSDVGAYLLRTDWRGAIEKILSYNPALIKAEEADKVAKDERERAQACDIYFTSYDFEKALLQIPRKFVAEASILRYFKERGMKGDGKGKGLDYLGAIQSIPRGLRTMYAHAYQSYVWNHVTSARLRMSNTQVLPGDLVLVEQERKPVVENEVDQDGEVVVAAAASADAEDDGIQRARPLTAEEAASGKYSIADVVLATPGWDIEYPANPELMAVYKEVMAKDRLDPNDMRRSVRDWSLTGSYRKMMSQFVDGECSYEVRRCKVGEQVVSTDLESFQAGSSTPGEKRKREDAEDTKMVDAVEDTEETVVVLRMRLGTSCYATMALRELMKGGVKAFKPEFGR